MSSLTCQDCGEEFATQYTLSRHYDRIHPITTDEESEDDSHASSSSSSSEESDSSSSDTTFSSDGNDDDDMEVESDDSQDEKADEGGEDNTVFYDMIDELYEQFEDQLTEIRDDLLVKGYDEKSAINGAHIALKSKLSKALREKIHQNIIKFNQLKRHSIYKIILKKADKLMQKENFDFKEAIQQALRYRKGLIERLLEEGRVEEEEEEEKETEDEEEEKEDSGDSEDSDIEDSDTEK